METRTRETQPPVLRDSVYIDDLRSGGVTRRNTWFFACLLIPSFACGGWAATDLATSAGSGGTGGARVASTGAGTFGGRGGSSAGGAGGDGGLGPDVSMGGGGGSGGARPSDASVADAMEASAADVRTTDASTQEARRVCMDKCERTYFSGASSASLIASDCCGGPCASSGGAACFGMAGGFRQPHAKGARQTRAPVPGGNGTWRPGRHRGR